MSRVYKLHWNCWCIYYSYKGFCSFKLNYWNDCYWLSVVSPTSEILMLKSCQCNNSRRKGRGLWMIMRSWGWSPSWMELVPLEEETQELILALCFLLSAGEDSGRREPSVHQEWGPCPTRGLQVSWSWTSRKSVTQAPWSMVCCYSSLNWLQIGLQFSFQWIAISMNKGFVVDQRNNTLYLET